jgi:hypothetical protein
MPDPPHAPPALHPDVASVYAARVADLQAALENGEDREALEAARALIDRVLLWPPETDGDPPGIEVIGELAALLQAAGIGTANPSGKSTCDPSVLTLFPLGSVQPTHPGKARATQAFSRCS